MKRSTVLLIIASMLAFAVIVIYASVSPVQAECEVCLEFDGELVCRSGAGATQDEARLAAQESACGGNTGSMAEAIVCRNRVPDRISCDGP